MREYVFITVKEVSNGDLEMTIGDKDFNDVARVLTCTVIDVISKTTIEVSLIVPKSQALSLIQALLTEDQLDAVLNA